MPRNLSKNRIPFQPETKLGHSYKVCVDFIGNKLKELCLHWF
uniref:Uncharacterized protein n=1 Tax=Rhizophora mucronata TaxID=61149 RepID=A0A2P2QBH4_RHIMU